MSRPDGGPAFPFPYPAASDAAVYGMSLRDYFAVAAIPSVLSAWLRTKPVTTPEDTISVAKAAYEIADDMLRERAK